MFAENPWDLAGALARQWFRDQCRFPFEPFHVFYRPSDGAQAGDVVVARDAPGAGYRDAGKMSSGWSIEQARAHLHAIVYPLPILPTAPVEAAPRRGGATRARRP